MTLDPMLITYISAVAEFVSLSRAADNLGVSVSTVSRKIEEAELSLGVRLFERDTRHLRLTEAGREFLHYVRKALHTLELGQQRMTSYSEDITGALKILCPPAFGREFVSKVVADFGVLHPALNITLQLEPRPFALSTSEFDIGICVGMPSEGRVVISRVFAYKSSFLATPDFFQRYGVPRSLSELAKLPLVNVFQAEELSQQTVLQAESGEQARYTSKLAVNDSSLALKAILTGHYIGKMMHWYANADLLEGRICKVLAEYTDEKSLYAVVQARKGNPRKVQLFVDYFKNCIQPAMSEIERKTHQLPYFG